MNRRYYQLIWRFVPITTNAALPGEGLETLAVRKADMWRFAVAFVNLRNIRIYLCLGGRSGLPETYEEISFR